MSQSQEDMDRESEWAHRSDVIKRLDKIISLLERMSHPLFKVSGGLVDLHLMDKDYITMLEVEQEKKRKENER